MRNGMFGRIGLHLYRFHVRAFAFHERRWITLGRVRHQPHHDFQQLGNTGAGLRRAKADRDQVRLAQRLFEGVVQLLGLEFLSLFQIQFHQCLVHLHHLVDDLTVGLLHGREIGRRIRALPRWGKKAIDNALAAICRQVDRQAFGAEGIFDLRGQFFQIDPRGIDLVDNDHTAQGSVVRRLPLTQGHGLDAVLGIDDDDRGFHRVQHRQRTAQEVWKSRRIEQIDVLAVGGESGDADVQRVLQVFFHLVVVADRGAFGHAAGLRDGSGGGEQSLDQRRLSGPGMADEGNVTDVLGVIVRHGSPPKF